AMPFPRRPLPRMARVRQYLPADRVDDVRSDVRQKLTAFASKIKPGDRVAITAGSRGIGGLLDLLAGIADAIKSCRGEPFIIPAMGSPGGATPEGQTEILRRLGVTEAATGAPIHATMETHDLGIAENGAVAHLDRIAAGADWIVVLGRTKTHPE